EERTLLRRAVDDEVGVEDLVPAVLAVGLREHHELDVRRVAPEALERLGEVQDLVLGEGEAEREVRGCDGTLAAPDRTEGRGTTQKRAPSRPRGAARGP